MHGQRHFAWSPLLAALLLTPLVACGGPAPRGTGGGGSSGTTVNGDGSGSSSGSSGSGSGSGSGGSSSGGTSSGGPIGGGSGSSSGGPTAGGGNGGGPDAGSGGTPASPYPSGPYGFAQGDTMQNFAFMGYRNGTGAWTQIQMSDYYDPDGSRGIRAVYVTLGEVGCGACVQEAPKINDWKTTYAPFGAAFLSGLWRGEVKNPDGTWSATQSTVDGWIAQFQITYDMMADPTMQLAGGSEPKDNPQGWLVDTRTMTIDTYYPGAPGMLYGMDQLLKKNGATGL